jgi:hypothetical protein
MIRARRARDGGGGARRVEGVAWALAFIWIGAGLLAGVDWGWLPIGLGVIALGAQAARRIAGEKMSGFWIACGVVLLASGAWERLHLRWRLAPVLLIFVGVAMLLNTVRRSGARR